MCYPAILVLTTSVSGALCLLYPLIAILVLTTSVSAVPCVSKALSLAESAQHVVVQEEKRCNVKSVDLCKRDCERRTKLCVLVTIPLVPVELDELDVVERRSVSNHVCESV